MSVQTKRVSLSGYGFPPYAEVLVRDPRHDEEALRLAALKRARKAERLRKELPHG